MIKDSKEILRMFISIQDTDKNIERLKKTIKLLPEEIDKHVRAFEEKEKEYSRLVEKATGSQKMIRTKERDARLLNETLQKLQTRLNSVKTNKEYSATLTEIDIAKNRISNTEDEELQIMEELDSLQRSIKLSENELAKEKEALEAIKNKNQNDLSDAAKRLECENEKKSKLIEQVGEQCYNDYKRVYDKRNHLAVVRIVDGSCGGCHQEIRPQLMVEVKKANSLISCPFCQRILYL